MFITSEFLRFTSFSSSVALKNRENDQENSTLLKIAACIPVLGLVINKIESQSIEEKLRKLALPRRLRPNSIMGNILSENASLKEIKTACKRAIQLELIARDYTKAALVNSLVTIALAIYALAINIIPFIIGTILIGGFSLIAAVFTFVLYTERSIKRYQEIGSKLS
jgi:hypothetical protein